MSSPIRNIDKSGDPLYLSEPINDLVNELGARYGLDNNEVVHIFKLSAKKVLGLEDRDQPLDLMPNGSIRIETGIGKDDKIKYLKPRQMKRVKRYFEESLLARSQRVRGDMELNYIKTRQSRIACGELIGVENNEARFIMYRGLNHKKSFAPILQAQGVLKLDGKTLLASDSDLPSKLERLSANNAGKKAFIFAQTSKYFIDKNGVLTFILVRKAPFFIQFRITGFFRDAAVSANLDTKNLQSAYEVKTIDFKENLITIVYDGAKIINRRLLRLVSDLAQRKLGMNIKFIELNQQKKGVCGHRKAG